MTQPSRGLAELNRAYFSPTVRGWAQAQGDIDTEMSKAMLGQESATHASPNAAVKVNHDLATAGQDLPRPAGAARGEQPLTMTQARP